MSDNIHIIGLLIFYATNILNYNKKIYSSQHFHAEKVKKAII